MSYKEFFNKTKIIIELTPLEITLYRIICVVCAFGMIIFGVLANTAYPDIIDPNPIRLSLAGIFVIIFFTSFIEPLKQFFAFFLISIAFIITYWLIILTHLNSYFFGFYPLWLFFILNLISVLIKKKLGLSIYLITTLLFFDFLSLITTLSPYILIFNLNSLALLILLTMRMNIQIKEKELQIFQEKLIGVTLHELQNPLTIVQGYIDLLQSDHEVGREQTEDILKIVSRNIGRLKRLILNLKDHTRIQANLFDIYISSVNYNQFCLRIKENLSFLYPKRVFKFEYLDKNLEEVGIRLDQDLIFQVVFNLIDNANKNSLSDKNVEIKLTKDVDNLRITVKDFGVGIPTTHLKNIFKPFFRGDGCYTSTGAGLGLFITKSIVEAHGGMIEVESVENLGSTFSVSIPLKR